MTVSINYITLNRDTDGFVPFRPIPFFNGKSFNKKTAMGTICSSHSHIKHQILSVNNVVLVLSEPRPIKTSSSVARFKTSYYKKFLISQYEKQFLYRSSPFLHTLSLSLFPVVCPSVCLFVSLFFCTFVCVLLKYGM